MNFHPALSQADGASLSVDSFSRKVTGWNCWLRLALKRSDTDPSGQHQSHAHNSSCSRDDKKPLKTKGYCSRLTANDKSWLWNAVRPICPSPLLTRCDINSVSKYMMTVLKAANTIGPRPIFFLKTSLLADLNVSV